MDIVTRLKQLAHAVADEDWSEFSMRVPADSERDADLVLLRASKEIESLRAELAECRAAASDAAHMLEITRVWGGLDWSWTNLHHSIAKRAWEKLTDALAAKGE